ncbi:RICIN domain-containing protein [Streptomyces sp. NPDC012508]|uniref:RICIN domain-containing protein n=1 Tax=Streptomyces sp. NPDC012508 TaxID=3364837 RepID=UPI003684C1CC
MGSFISRRRMAKNAAAAGVAAMSIVGMSAVNAPTASADTFLGGRVSAEYYHIKPLHSAKALTVASLNEGAEIRQNTPGGTNLTSYLAKLQMFRTIDFGNGVESYMLLKNIRATNGAMVPGCISRTGPYNNEKLVIKKCNATPSQQFTYNMVGPGEHYEIRGVASNFYWHIQNASMADGANLVQYTGPGGWNARFRWVYAGELATFN